MTEINGCSGGEPSCLCGGANPFSIRANSHCEQATPCGGEGQRACCLFEASFGACRSGLAEIPGCSGDCLCGGDANPFALRASGTCILPSPCGGKGQRACVVLERPQGACDAGLFEVPRCTGDCFGKGLGSSFGVSSGVCTVRETIEEPTTNRIEPLPDAPTPPSSTCRLHGYADMHLHLFADLAHGGGVLAGKPYDPDGGVNAALQQCAGSNLDLVGSKGNELPGPGLPCPTSLYPGGCGSTILHGGHDIFNEPIGSPLGTRDGALEGLGGENSNVGAPVFNGWPLWTSTTHQQSYYKWLERAWQGGLRLVTMLAVTNEALCRGSKRLRGTNCEDSMASIDAQIQAAKDLESFIDEQYGTDEENKGWFRIVLTPLEARQAIAAGKLAVVLGIETAELFNCKFPIEQCQITGDLATRTVTCPGTLGIAASGPHTTPPPPTCSPDFVRSQVDKYYNMGVRHVFPIHNFDNGFGGAATWQDGIEVGNRAVENHWWFSEACPDDPSPYGFQLGTLTQLFLTLFGFADLIQDFPLRLGTDPPSCNSYGLFELGRHVVEALMDNGMLIDVDHMSRRAFDTTLDMAEAHGYPGIVASHVLSFDLHDGVVRHERMRTKAQLERIRGVGGMIAVMLKDEVQDTDKRGKKHTLDYPNSNVVNDCRHSSKSFAQGLEYAVDVMGGPVAMGSDFNGVAGHFGPRFGSDACGGIADHGDVAGRDRERSAQNRAGNRLTYPFTLPGFGTFDKQVTGQRTFDYNTDGLAHVGLMPDLVADLKTIGVADSDLNMLFRSAEAYIHVWEGARHSGMGEAPAANRPGCASVTGVYPSPAFDNTLLFFSATNLAPPGALVTWDFGDGGAASGALATHKYAQTGTYTVTVRATDPLLDGTAQHTGTVVVQNSNNTLLGAQISIDAPIETFEGDSVAIRFKHSIFWQFNSASCGGGVAPQFVSSPTLLNERTMGCAYPGGLPPIVNIGVTVVQRNLFTGQIESSFTYTQPIRILNRPPGIVAADASSAWGSLFTQTVQLQDVPGDVLSLGIQWGDGSQETFASLAPGPRTLSHFYALPTRVGEAYHVVLSLSDEATSVTRTLNVEVVDPPPLLDLSGPEHSAMDRIERYSFSGHDPDGGTVSLVQLSCGPAGELVSGPAAVEAGVVYAFDCRFTAATALNPVSVAYRDDEGRKTVAILLVGILDITPPVVTVPFPIVREATSALGASVAFDASAQDDVDGPLPVSCTAPSGSTFPLGESAVTCTAIDAAGNTGSASFSVNVVDTTPPEITGSVSPEPNAAGWHRDSATIAWAVTDLVGVASTTGCGDVTFGEETNGTVVTCTAGDAAGNTSSRSLTVRLDRMPPAVDFGAASPSANANGWHKSDVRLPFTIGDAGSGLPAQAPTGGTLTFSGEGAGQTQTVTAVDIAGNSASVASPAIHLDKTSPTIVGSLSPDPNSGGWHNVDVTVSFACADQLSGIEACSQAATLSGDGASQSYMGAATDLAGNTASVTVGSINIDKTPPVVSCSNSTPTLWPPNHRLVTVETAVAADDGLSGSAGFTLTAATSNEPDNGLVDGDTAGDIQGFVVGTPDTRGQLRAERAGAGSGRIYSIVYEGSDVAGNKATCTTQVTVPHSAAAAKKGK